MQFTIYRIGKDTTGSDIGLIPLVFHHSPVVFTVEECADGLSFWATKNAESDELFATANEAQQDALDYVRQQIADEEHDLADRLEDEMHGTMEEQVDSLYYSTRL